MWNLSNYGNDLRIKKEDALIGYHQGECDQDIQTLEKVPYIRKQLEKLDPKNLKRELEEYGAWEESELSDHQANLSRWLWLSCGDIYDRIINYQRRTK